MLLPRHQHGSSDGRIRTITMFPINHLQPVYQQERERVTGTYQCCCSRLLLWNGSSSLSSRALPTPIVKLPKKVARRWCSIFSFSSCVYSRSSKADEAVDGVWSPFVSPSPNWRRLAACSPLLHLSLVTALYYPYKVEGLPRANIIPILELFLGIRVFFRILDKLPPSRIFIPARQLLKHEWKEDQQLSLRMIPTTLMTSIVFLNHYRRFLLFGCSAKNIIYSISLRAGAWLDSTRSSCRFLG